MEYKLQSDEINELAQALCKAQGTISGARKDSKNPFFKSNYADLGSVTEAIRESFTANDLSYTQTNIPADNGVTVVTTLMHKSGQWSRGFLFLPATKLDPQQFGSAMTYARRYGLAAMAGVVQEDDDGNAASKPKEYVNKHEDGSKKNEQLKNDFKATMLSVTTIEALDAEMKKCEAAWNNWPEHWQKGIKEIYLQREKELAK
jgi:hypothetical protein